MKDDPFNGWLRELPDGCWRLVCTGATRAECWRRLLRLEKPARCEARVMEKGKDPAR